MWVTRTVVLSLFIAVPCLLLGVYWICYGVSQAVWEYPEATATMTFEDWTPDLKKLHQNTVYPYRSWGLHLSTVGLVLVLVPLISYQVAREAAAP